MGCEAAGWLAVGKGVAIVVCVKNRRVSERELRLVYLLRKPGLLDGLRGLGSDVVNKFVDIWSGHDMDECSSLINDMYYSRNNILLKSYVQLADSQYAALLYKRKAYPEFPNIQAGEGSLDIMNFLGLVKEGQVRTLGSLVDDGYLSGQQYDEIVLGAGDVCIRGSANTGKVALFDGYLLYCARNGVSVVVSDGYSASWLSLRGSGSVYFAGDAMDELAAYVRSVEGGMVFAVTSPGLGLSQEHYKEVRKWLHGSLRVVMVVQSWGTVSGFWKERMENVRLVNTGFVGGKPQVLGIRGGV